MTKLSFILILMALVQSTWAQTNGSASSDVVKTIEHPDFTALFTYDIEISKVEFSKEQTTLYFDFSHYTTTSFGFRSTTYLMDEEGKRYPIKGCKGFQLDKGYNVKEDGVKEISISFEPLPEGTRVFDCIEGPDLQWSFQFYGIREKGQDWNVFPEKEVADNPFPESFFCVDTVYVTGRITQSRYDRWGRIEHDSNSYAEQALRRQFRLGNGAFDHFYVAKDGTFSFKTIVAKPTMDELFIPGGRIPILLIPGDHLQVDISHWGEYNQQVTIRSEKGDYSRMLTNYPFLYEREIAYMGGTLSESEAGKLAAETWQPLHDEQAKRMEVCRYLAAKHHFTPTELKLMQMNVQISDAFISYIRMTSPLYLKYRKEYDLYVKAKYDKTKWPQERFSVEELEADSIFLDLSFIKDCHWDDPTISATKYYETLLRKLLGLTHIMFAPGTEKPSSENDSINIFAAAEQLGIGEVLIGYYLTSNKYGKMTNNPELRHKIEGIVDDLKLPHAFVLSKTALMYDLNDYKARSYPADQSIAADVIKKLSAPYKGKKVLLLPLSCYKPDGLQKIDSLYQARRAEIDKEAVFLPVATPKFTSKQELKELQQKYPTLKNTVYLEEEELLRLYIAFQRGNGPQTDPEMLILQDGTFGIPGYLFLDNYRKKK